MAEIFPKNHNFFLFFFHFLKNIRPVVKFRQKKKPLLLAIENLQNHLIINVILRNGGSNP
jgi:hypothetical protein